MDEAGLILLLLLLLGGLGGGGGGGGGGGPEEDPPEPDPIEPIYDDFDGATVQPDDGAVDGTANADLIFGGILANGPQDTLDDTNPDDVITAGAGDDTVFGGPGDDSITGGADNDLIDGGEDDFDTIFGGDGDDTLIAGDGIETGNELFGEAGNDLLLAGERAFDTLDGGPDDDTLQGALNAFTIFLPGTGNDSVDVGEGGGRIILGEGNDTYHGGDSRTELQVEATETRGVNADLQAGTVTGLGSTTVSDIQDFTGALGDDTIRADDGFNAMLSGGGGADSITGGLGDDALSGGAGEDTLDGGAGADGVTSGAGADTIVVGENDTIQDWTPDEDFMDLTGVYDTLEDAREDLVGGVLQTLNLQMFLASPIGTPISEGDLTTANTGLPPAFSVADVIFDDFDGTTVQPDDGSIAGTEARDVIYGGLQADGAQDTTDGGVANDTINAGGNGDTVFGGPGFDAINGEAGNDSLVGGDGAVTLLGGEGDDTLIANDDEEPAFGVSIEGGAGNDSIVVTGNEVTFLFGGTEDDTIDASGASLINNIDPGPGNDSVLGGAFFNAVQLTEGDDTLTMIGTQDQLLVNDTITTDIQVDLLNGVATGLGTSQISGFDEVATARGNDTIIGDDDGNGLLLGNAGNDSIVGGDGADTLNGGADNDTLDGGGSGDLIQTGDGFDRVVVGENDTISDFDPANDFIDLTPFYVSIEDARADYATGTANVLDTINVSLPGIVATDLTPANTGLPFAEEEGPIAL